MELFLEDLAGQLREVRTNDKIAISLVTELVKGVPEEYRPRVAQVIRDRIRTVGGWAVGFFPWLTFCKAPTAPLNEVLPSFYVLDSIVKLVGGSFVQLLGEGLKELFMEAFYRMPDGRTRLCHVLDTWKNVFPTPLLADIRAALPLPVAAPVMAAPVAQPSFAHLGAGLLGSLPLAYGAPPPEKRLRLDTVIQQQEQHIAEQAQQALASLEAEVRQQRHGPTPQQLRTLEELRSVLLQLHAPAPPLLAAPVAAVPAPARPAVTVLQMPVSHTSASSDSYAVRALDTLYAPRLAGRPCPTCALRFREEAAYKDHLDWHFKQNKLAGRARQVQSRAWYLPVAAWHADAASEAGLAVATPFEAPAKPETAPAAGAGEQVVADANFKTCAVCNEPFEPVWDDEENEWVYRSASRIESGGIAHVECQRP